jgi:hypothetical protein
MCNNLVGFTLMAFQDIYGFFGGASYSSEVHISDVILSFCGMNFGFLGMVIVCLIPSETSNNLTIMSKVPNTVFLSIYFRPITK